jgi:hypothetical protein
VLRVDHSPLKVVDRRHHPHLADSDQQRHTACFAQVM